MTKKQEYGFFSPTQMKNNMLLIYEPYYSIHHKKDSFEEIVCSEIASFNSEKEAFDYAKKHAYKDMKCLGPILKKF
jgi:hypothetical protein